MRGQGTRCKQLQNDLKEVRRYGNRREH